VSTVNVHEPVPDGIATWQCHGVTFGDRLRSVRKERGLRGVQLADLTGLDSSSISRWERNQRNPGSAELGKLAKALGVTERWLLTGEPPKIPTLTVGGPPNGEAALEMVLAEHGVWPDDFPVALADQITATLRTEAHAPEGRDRPASVWRLRLSQLVRARGSPRTPVRVIGAKR
jgi:transcriptional regulator with XRE-family HTH domain